MRHHDKRKTHGRTRLLGGGVAGCRRAFEKRNQLAWRVTRERAQRWAQRRNAPYLRTQARQQPQHAARTPHMRHRATACLCCILVTFI